MKSMTKEELQDVLLEIAKEFHRICTRNNIPYYMLGGTMLGAVRHKGFIPWDDDMDFGIPRKDFKRCLDILNKELPEKYEMLSIDCSKCILNECVKISDKHTLIHEFYKENCVNEFGVNIDLFPLDFTDDNLGLFSRNRMIDILHKIQQYRFLSVKQRPIHKKVVAFLVKIIFFPLGRKNMVNYIQRFLLLETGNCMANHCGAWGLKEIISNNVMGTPQLYSFEDTQFYGVQDADAYLKCLYGNYMQLPPKDKRHLHIIHAFFK